MSEPTTTDINSSTNANILVRRAERADIPALSDLIAALADFEKLAPPDLDAQARFVGDGWPDDGQTPRFMAWIAHVHDPASGTSSPAAYAITFETYSSFLARPTLYLEDIFVRVEYRRHGIGLTLMQHLIEQARSRGCGRVEWVVLDWNTGAQEFYKTLGARHLSEWHTYRMDLS